MIGNLVDVLHHAIYPAEIVISDGKIDEIKQLNTMLPDAPYIMPGFIDSHIHIESSLLTPSGFAQLAVRQGTVAVITDPHEIANVCGLDGIEWMMEDAARCIFHFHFGIPSCVPCSPFEGNGAFLDASNTRYLLGRDNVYGLAEMMNFVATIHHGGETMNKIGDALAAGKCVDGHAPDLDYDDAKSYIKAGVTTDHEVVDINVAHRRLKYGMKLQIREGSAARNFDTLSPLIDNDEYCGKLMLCTDDIYPDELCQWHINDLVSRSINHGNDLWNTLYAACVTPVRHYKLPVGLLQEGDSADFVVVNDLNHFDVLATYINGCEVYRKEGDVVSVVKAGTSIAEPINNWKVQPIQLSDLRLKAQSKNIRVIGAADGSLYTKALIFPAKIEKTFAVSDVQRDILKIVVLNRYVQRRPQVAFVNGFGLKKGAMASTIAHDSHNIIAVGTNDDDLLAAINTLVEHKGGLCVADGDDISVMPLPLAGLMSMHQPRKVADEYATIRSKAFELGCSFKAPFMTLSFMALPVIPEIKITDLMFIDSTNFQPISQFC